MNVLRSMRIAALIVLVPARSTEASPMTVTHGDSRAVIHALPATQIYMGMWTAHFRHLRRGFDKNWLVGISWRSLYGGTFINSYGDRAFTAGVQRTVARGTGGVVIPTVGYRVGLVTGYDGRLVPIASKTPVLPLMQVVSGLDYGRMGVEAAWAGIVGSLGPRIRF